MQWERWLRPAVVVVGVLVAASVVALLVSGGDDDDGTAVATRATTTSTESSTSTSLASTTSTTTAATTTTTTGRVAPATAPPTTRPAVTTTPGSPACQQPGPGSDFRGFGATTIVIENAEGTHRSCVLTADTDAQRQRGLMHQDDLDGYEGMIFRYPDEQNRTFWMRNTRIPLSIAFFAANGAFVSSADMEPCGDRSDCPTYPSAGPAKYALEVLKGRLPAVGATPGSRLTSPG